MGGGPMAKLALITAAASLLLLSCGGAPPADKTATPNTPEREAESAGGKGAAAGPGEDDKAPVQKPAKGFTTFTDPKYGFQADLFGEQDRGETHTVNGPKGTATIYTVGTKDHDRVQILNVQAVKFPSGKTPEGVGCKALLPTLLKEIAVDRLACGAPSNPRLLQHDPAGVFSITVDVPGCLKVPQAKGTIHTVCDERAPGQIVMLALAAIAEDAEDPMNKWFLCSVKLKGDVLTCPWLAKKK